MLGAMPWAPMVDGKEAVNEYHTQLMNSMGPKSAKLIKGYRYLVQDKPDGQLLLPHFIESFQWLSMIVRPLVFFSSCSNSSNCLNPRR